MQEAAAAYLVVLVGGFLLLVAWVLLPFMLFGLKPLVRRMIAEQAETNQHLRELRATLDKAQAQAAQQAKRDTAAR
jgi:hypothetical protein